MEDESPVLVEDVVDGEDEVDDKDDVEAPTTAMQSPFPSSALRAPDPAAAATSVCVVAGVEVGPQDACGHHRRRCHELLPLPFGSPLLP
jgi:hypothetical protein